MASGKNRSAHPLPVASVSAPSEPILVGEVVRPHGLRGEVKIVVHSDVPERFAVGGSLFAVPRAGNRRRLTVSSCRDVRGGLLVGFRGVEDRDQADELRGSLLQVDAAEVPEPPEGCYYYFQLEGCLCRDRSHGDLGTVRSVVEDGGGLLLEVEADGNEVLVPFVEAYLESVDVTNQLIEVNLPPGFLEICVSKS